MKYDWEKYNNTIEKLLDIPILGLVYTSAFARAELIKMQKEKVVSIEKQNELFQAINKRNSE